MLTLSGPNLDLRLRGYSLNAALSRATTEAERARLEEASYYVRDQAGEVIGRVDREQGITLVRRVDVPRRPAKDRVLVKQFGQTYEIARIPEPVLA